MKKKTEKKSIIKKTEDQLLAKQARQFLLDDIVGKTDANSKERVKRKKQKKESLTIILNSGEKIIIDEYVSQTYSKKRTHYHKSSFYNPIADLLGQSHDVMKPFRKQRIVALLKRKFIWGRFPNAVQTKIYRKNKYTGYCTRDYWNYQLLTKKADDMCLAYIKEFENSAANVLENNGRLKEFIIEHSIKCGLPIQLDMFNDFISK